MLQTQLELCIVDLRKLPGMEWPPGFPEGLAAMELYPPVSLLTFPTLNSFLGFAFSDPNRPTSTEGGCLIGTLFSVQAAPRRVGGGVVVFNLWCFPSCYANGECTADRVTRRCVVCGTVHVRKQRPLSHTFHQEVGNPVSKCLLLVPASFLWCFPRHFTQF